MSHFTVLVVSKPGQDLDEQLAPFDEDRRAEFAEDDECDVDSVTGKRGYWRNGQARWDWWVIGGRWSGQLITKDGQHVDQARKGDLALDLMYADGRANATERLRLYQATVEEHGPIPSRDWLQLSPASEEFKAARTAFWAHPTVEATMGYGPAPHPHLEFEDVEWIERTPEGWIEGQATSSVVCFAMLTHDGQWLEQGEMGWFGVSDTTVASKTGYLEVARAYLDSVDDDMIISLIDAHI